MGDPRQLTDWSVSVKSRPVARELVFQVGDLRR